MGNKFTILIADRNRHVRDYLRREFMADGYHVKLAKDDSEIFVLLQDDVPTDLVILDLEMPYSAGLDVLKQLLSQSPNVPVVVHTLTSDQVAHEAKNMAAAFIEKRGNSIDRLKAIVDEVLRKCHPNHPGHSAANRELSHDHGAEESVRNSR